jgi:hypothetical protein
MTLITLGHAPREMYYLLLSDELRGADPGGGFEVELCDPKAPEGVANAYRAGRPAHAREARFLWRQIESHVRGFREQFRTEFRRHCDCGADIYEVRRL